MEEFTWKDIKVSGGPEIVDNSEVSVLYKVALSKEDLCNGKFIESTYNPDVPVRVRVNEKSLLCGVYKGILGMRGGGSVRQITIPAAMAFGERGFAGITSNKDIYVEVCAVSVDNDSINE